MDKEIKQKELNDLKNELIAWLNDECPATFPPLEPYVTADLSHSFADGLRIRLDKITIKRGELAALQSEPKTTSGELYKKVYIKSESDLPKEDNEYIVHFPTFESVVCLNKEAFKHHKHRIDWYLQPLQSDLGKDKEKLMCIIIENIWRYCEGGNGEKAVLSFLDVDGVANEIILEYFNEEKPAICMAPGSCIYPIEGEIRVECKDCYQWSKNKNK